MWVSMAQSKNMNELTEGCEERNELSQFIWETKINIKSRISDSFCFSNFLTLILHN